MSRRTSKATCCTGCATVPGRSSRPTPEIRAGSLPVALYDLDADPKELHNLAQSEASRTAQMLAALQRQEAQIQERAALDGGPARLADRRP